MFSFNLKCPHCSCLEHFKIYRIENYHAREPAQTTPSLNITNIPRNPNDNSPAQTYGTANCPRVNCGGPVLIWFESRHLSFRDTGRSMNGTEWIYNGPQLKVLGVWPTPPCPDDSEYWPEKLRTVFSEVQEDISLNRDPSRIVGTCRSILEVALSNLGYDKSKGKVLSDRIDAARNDGLLTEAMREWAHKTRMDGNDALHELNSTKEEAVELVNFIRTFLEITFDLPKRIANLSSIAN